jgi:hypothetical protein
MKTIAQITEELAQAELVVRTLRDERSRALNERSTLKIGNEFTRGGTTYKVYSVAACSKGSEVWLHCRWITKANKWSTGTRVLNHKVED